MATIAQPLPSTTAQTSEKPQAHPHSSIRYDGFMIVLGLWFTLGVFMDGAAHAHNLVDTFFTPWHAILYSGFLANALGLFVLVWRNQRNGLRFWDAIPAGYEMSVVGALIFGVGGVCDLIWHTTLGIERSTEALLSPPHLMLATGIFLVVNGPFRAAWHRTDPTRGNILAWLPMLISLAFTFLVLTFFTFTVNPFVEVWPSIAYHAGISAETTVNRGLAQILFQAALFSGCALIAIRRWWLPFGSITFLIVLNLLGLTVIYNSIINFLPMALVTGLFADSLIQLTRPSLSRPVALRVFAFTVPAVLYLLFFLTIQLTGGVSWTIPFWSGTCVLAGVVGLLLSYLMVPAALPAPPQSS